MMAAVARTGRRMAKPGRCALAAYLVGSLGVSAASDVPEFTLPAGSVREAALLPFRVNGRPVVLQSFVVPRTLPHVAAGLMPQLPRQALMSGLPDGVSISWSDKSWLWSVRLRGLGPALTHGTVSGSDRAGGATVATPAPAWLPPDARLALDVRTRQGARQSTQQVYLHAASAPRLSSLLRAGLTRCGWSPVVESGGAAQWQRAGAQLDVVLVTRSGGSGVVLHWVEPVAAIKEAGIC